MSGAALMAAAGVTFASTHAFWLLLRAGTLGVISPSRREVGPVLSIEQAALSHVVALTVENHGALRRIEPADQASRTAAPA